MRMNCSGLTKKYHISRLLAPVICKEGPSYGDIARYLDFMSFPSAEAVNEEVADEKRRAISVGNFLNLENYYLEVYRFLLKDVCDIPYTMCEYLCDEALNCLYTTMIENTLMSSGLLDSIVMKFETADSNEWKLSLPSRYSRAYRLSKNDGPKYRFTDVDEAIDSLKNYMNTQVRSTLTHATLAVGVSPSILECKTHVYCESDFICPVSGDLAWILWNCCAMYVRFRVLDILYNDRLSELWSFPKLLFNPSTFRIVSRDTFDFHYTTLHGTDLDFDDLVNAIVHLSTKTGLAINAHGLLMAMELGHDTDVVNMAHSTEP